MKPLFKMGDRVRLTQKGLGGYSRHARNGVEWIERRGTVCRSTKREEAYVEPAKRPNQALQPNQLLISLSNPRKSDQHKLKERLYEVAATNEGLR